MPTHFQYPGDTESSSDHKTNCGGSYRAKFNVGAGAGAATARGRRVGRVGVALTLDLPYILQSCPPRADTGEAVAVGLATGCAVAV
jgi:hypothetical protein